MVRSPQQAYDTATTSEPQVSFLFFTCTTSGQFTAAFALCLSNYIAVSSGCLVLTRISPSCLPLTHSTPNCQVLAHIIPSCLTLIHITLNCLPLIHIISGFPGPAHSALHCPPQIHALQKYAATANMSDFSSRQSIFSPILALYF